VPHPHDVAAGSRRTEGRRRPFFSVVTVTRNAGDALRRTVASVAGQSWRDLEHVVKDGRSTDGSTAFAAGVPGVRLVSTSDRGIYDAMNEALRSCEGHLVVFLNAGDVLASPDVLERVAEHARRHEADLYYSDVHLGDAAATVRYPDRLDDFFLFRGQVVHQACFFTREAYRRLGDFDTSLRFSADYDFFLRALLGARLRASHVPIVATIYEGGGFSARRESWPRVVEEGRRIRARHFSRRDRLVFGLGVALTLRPLRNAVLRSDTFRGIRPLYQRAVNAWYQRRSRRRPRCAF
jgi:glycosyltransferase involved in cell wall biosynthesis